MTRAVIFDLGGVVFPSPFEAFDAYDLDADLPAGSVRALDPNQQRSGGVGRARTRRTQPVRLLRRSPPKRAPPDSISTREALMTQSGEGLRARPAMAVAIRRIREAGLRTAALTNNWPRGDARSLRPQVTGWVSTS